MGACGGHCAHLVEEPSTPRTCPPQGDHFQCKTRSLDDAPESDSMRCGICFEDTSSFRSRKTKCCQQWMCHHCAASDHIYKDVPTCPFCRHEHYELDVGHGTEELCLGDVKPLRSCLDLEGVWDVHITESSKIGSWSYDAVLDIHGTTAEYEVCNNRFDGVKWRDLTMGHTPSGQSFVARQTMTRAPSWCHGATLLGPGGLQGRRCGADCAKFTTSMTLVANRGDDEMEIVQKAEMKRRV